MSDTVFVRTENLKKTYMLGNVTVRHPGQRRVTQRLDLRQGDTLRLTTEQGERDFEIAGTVVDYSDFIHRLRKIA